MPIREMKLCKPPVTEAGIDGAETEMGLELPPAFRSFLLQYNGGRPVPAGFKFGLGAYQDSRVHAFACVAEGETHDVRRMAKVFGPRMPPTLFPIGKDPFGNVIAMGVSGEQAGKVYFWDHEKEPGASPDFSNISEVAPSFEAFIDGLSDFDE